MSLINPTFENFLCRDCGYLSPGAELKSFSTVAPPHNEFSYDGTCVECGSSNTERRGLFDDSGLEIGNSARDKWDND